MNKILEKLRQTFQGNADGLIATAQEVVAKLKIDQEAGEGNERLLRHYVSVGVVDKPLREGRDANYGFRHLVQYIAARRLLAEGFTLAKIASYTAAVTTEDLARYLEKPDRTSEAELLVAAFRAEGTTRASSTTASGKAPAPGKPLPSSAASMGMVDVMHEMRDMEKRMRHQLDAIRQEVHQMFDDASRHMSSRAPSASSDPVAFKRALGEIAQVMDRTVERLEDVLKRPVMMIEKQMAQQRYLFDEAYRQKDFLEKMFADVFDRQRHEVNKIATEQTHFLERLRSDLLQGQREIEKHLESLVRQTLNERSALRPLPNERTTSTSTEPQTAATPNTPAK